MIDQIEIYLALALCFYLFPTSLCYSLALDYFRHGELFREFADDTEFEESGKIS